MKNEIPSRINLGNNRLRNANYWVDLATSHFSKTLWELNDERTYPRIGFTCRLEKATYMYDQEHQYEEYEYILRTDGNWYVNQGNGYELLASALGRIKA